MIAWHDGMLVTSMPCVPSSKQEDEGRGQGMQSELRFSPPSLV
jgi:hypothetical protein